ncbi:MAG: 50S ribosomal protein L4 [Bacteroidetes bacterium]|nr:50S ribosomal protein L4 [Bacteroidota bacterium]MBU1720688.1 50S ribosomal protein L4 [Bacteroidota bacterium]
MELEVYKINGEKSGRTLSLPEDIFGITPNDHAIYLDVKQIMANKRQGTHSAKEKSQLSGSTRKLKKQKGSGSARYGSIKSPLFKGGARVFGPRPRDYGIKLNKKVKILARKSALAYKAQGQSITLLEDFNLDAPKTKAYTEILNNLKLEDKKTLLVLPETNKNVYLSSRNLQQARVIRVSELNTYEILDASNLIFVESSVKAVEELFAVK